MADSIKLIKILPTTRPCFISRNSIRLILTAQLVAFLLTISIVPPNDGHFVSRQSETIEREEVFASFRQKREENLCPSNVCLNGGSCLLKHQNNVNSSRLQSVEALDIDYECRCASGYAGDICEQKCPLKCQNGGQCAINYTTTTSGEDPTFICQCPTGFAGLLCTEGVSCQLTGCLNTSQICLFDPVTGIYGCETNLCTISGDPCANNSTCRPIRNDFICECPLGYGGRLCDADIDECVQEPGEPEARCKNGGTCENTDGGFLCHCEGGFQGDFCELQSPTTSISTTSESEARSTDASATSTYASNIHDPCIVRNNADEELTGRCQNGGECISIGTNRSFCICHGPFSGHFCELESSSPSNTGSNAIEGNGDGLTVEANCTVAGRRCLNSGRCVRQRQNISVKSKKMTQNDTQHHEFSTDVTYCECVGPWTGTWCDQRRFDMTFNKNKNSAFTGFWSRSNTTPKASTTTATPITASGKTETSEDGLMTCPDGFCENGGTCFRRPNDELTEEDGPFGCHCPANITGQFCESTAESSDSACSSNPCQNGGQCHIAEEKNGTPFSCKCSDRWTGAQCELECPLCGPELQCRESPEAPGTTECFRVSSNDTGVGDFGLNLDNNLTQTQKELTLTQIHTSTLTTTLSPQTTTDYASTEETSPLPDFDLFPTPSAMIIVDGSTRKKIESNVSNCAECVNAAKCLVSTDGNAHCLCSRDFKGTLCDVRKSACSTLDCPNGSGQVCRLERTPSQERPYCGCPPGLYGKNCDQPTAVTFGNTSLALVQLLPRHYLADYRLEFAFRTTLSNVVLVSGEGLLGQMEFAIELRKDGRLVVVLGEASSTAVFDVVDLALNDADWYAIRLTSSVTGGAGIRLELLHQETGYLLVRRQLTGASRTVSIFTTRFGRRERSAYFIGCLRDIRLNGKSIDLLAEQRSMDLVSGCAREKDLCLPESCDNGAKCVDLWTTFTCDCPRPFLPPECARKMEEATFGHENRSTIVEYSLDSTTSALIMNSTRISFLLRTNQLENAPLFYLGERGNDDVGTFISAELVQGRPRINVRLGGKNVQTLASTARPLNDNVPHIVEVNRERNEIVILVDGRAEPSMRISRPFEHPLLADQLVVGAKVPTLREEAFSNSSMLTQNYFKGTLQDFRINNRFVVLSDDPIMADFPEVAAAMFGHKTSDQNLLQGTVSDDVCAQWTPCKNGDCANTFNAFKCHCHSGWIGALCDQRDHCGNSNQSGAPSPCPFESRCVNSHGGFVCLSEATLAPTSSIRYLLRQPGQGNPSLEEPVKKHTNMTFEIRTRTESAQILKLQSSTESLTMELHDSGHELKFTYASQSANKQGSIAGAGILSDGQWHSVAVIAERASKKQQLIVVLDTTRIRLPEEISSAFSFKHFALDPNARITIGRAQNATNGFKGCLRNLRFGALPPLSFFNHGQDSLRNTAHFEVQLLENVRDGCHSADICSSRANPCKNGGTCEDLFNKRRCICPPGFDGELCERNIDECANAGDGKAPCEHGKCVDLVNGYRCDCAPGFSGPKCQTLDEQCQPGSCLNGGKCRTSNGTAHCDCRGEFIGSRCQVAANAKCSDIPCQNGAQCFESKNGEIGCVCLSGFEGELCDVAIDPCLEMPCKNGGKCRQSKSTSLNASLDFVCECPKQYSGRLCERFVDTCSSLVRPCNGHGTCHNIFGGNICECPEAEWRGPNCELKVDECEENAPCLNNGTCANLTPKGFRCECPKFYLGERCEIAGICANNPCKNNAECLQMSATEHTCKCQKGFEGKYCEKQIDYCALSDPCQNGGTCHPVIGDYSCTCIPGFTGNKCETDIDDCAQPTNNTCQNGGQCIDRINGFECNCRGTGFKGPLCQIDIDECDEASLNCVNGTCENIPGSYRCTCHQGYIGNKCHMVNPCVNDVHNRTLHSCGAHGRCVRPTVVVQQSGREVSQHECECDDDYAGSQCTLLVQPQHPLAIGNFIGLGIVVLAICVCLGMLLYFFVTCTRKKRANQGTYSPSTQEMTGTTARIPTNRSYSNQQDPLSNYRQYHHHPKTKIKP